MDILVINGPNLNLLGTRQTDIYGNKSYEELCNEIKHYAEKKAVNVEIQQTNLEGIIIDLLHYAHDKKMAGVILNAAAYTHSSYAIYDAILAIDVPVVEVHISDPKTRKEAFRHTSIIEPACIKTFSGEGLNSYLKAMDILRGLNNAA